MKSLLKIALISIYLTGATMAQIPVQPNAESPLQNTAVRFSPGTVIRVELAKSVDAKKAKVGDQVIAKTMDDFFSDKNEVLAPKGSQVLAHVAEVSPHEGKSASTLGIAFDKILLKNGTEVPLKASIQAIGAPESNTAAVDDTLNTPSPTGGIVPMGSSSRVGSGAGLPVPGATAPGTPVPGTPGPPGPEANSGRAINGRLTPNAQGVVGMSGLSLSPGAAQDSLLTSPKHNVKLDSGTQMILRVIP
jgi:hypothetical protein